MRTMPTLDYMGYAVVVNAVPAPGNRYYSVLSIHRHSSHGFALKTPAIYQEDADDGVICETVELAYQDAAERARAWIDANPVN